MEVRPLQPADEQSLRDFFSRLPEGDLTFVKEDVLDPSTIHAWSAAPSGVRRRVAVDDDGRVVGFVSVSPQSGWSSHVGEVRLVVDAEQRGQGLGRAMARGALLEALSMGLSKTFVEVVADQQAAVGMFTALGFDPEALLRGHIRDRDGELRDLVVLAHSVDDAWSGMSAAGIDDEVG